MLRDSPFVLVLNKANREETQASFKNTNPEGLLHELGNLKNKPWKKMPKGKKKK